MLKVVHTTEVMQHCSILFCLLCWSNYQKQTKIDVDHVEFVRKIMYSITNDFDGILAGIPNGRGRKMKDSFAIRGYVFLFTHLLNQEWEVYFICIVRCL
jgi:hypothetical protein